MESAWSVPHRHAVEVVSWLAGDAWARGGVGVVSFTKEALFEVNVAWAFILEWSWCVGWG